MKFSTEVTSSKIESDTPLFFRTKKAYEIAVNHIKGKVLEVGSGEGYGVDILKNNCSKIYALDKIEPQDNKDNRIINIQQKVPPFKNLKNNFFDFVISFQVLEHIKEDVFFLEEIYRVLKPGGVLLLTTPNKSHTVVRNPWHIREYNYKELKTLATSIFDDVTIKGINAKDSTMAYYSASKIRVQKIIKYDVFNLIDYLSPSILKIPYEILNRINRKKLYETNATIVLKIDDKSYFLADYNQNTLDFFCYLKKSDFKQK